MPNRLPLPPSVMEDLPPPSTELTLIGVHWQVTIWAVTRKKRPSRRKVLAKLMDLYEMYEGQSGVVRLRSRDHDAAVTNARRRAFAYDRAEMAAHHMLEARSRPG